ncbi:hypothetical protein BGW42_001695 [Actinomortierella wolfii]|nr:hypothetical protein BGW42_001695 [Actinomortierella wolfii]KAG0237553.1 hypothetical protein BGW41_008353 [Actinomortierella wolfii]
MAEKLTNSVNAALGGAKETIGKAIGNQQIAAEGAAARAQAQAAQATADTQRKVEGIVDDIKGRVNATLGAATGNHSREAQGKVQEATGDFKRAIS